MRTHATARDERCASGQAEQLQAASRSILLTRSTRPAKITSAFRMPRCSSRRHCSVYRALPQIWVRRHSPCVSIRGEEEEGSYGRKACESWKSPGAAKDMRHALDVAFDRVHATNRLLTFRDSICNDFEFGRAESCRLKIFPSISRRCH